MQTALKREDFSQNCQVLEGQQFQPFAQVCPRPYAALRLWQGLGLEALRDVRRLQFWLQETHHLSVFGVGTRK